LDGPANFPLRQYRRCRDDFFTGVVQTVLLLALVVAFAVFTRTLWMVLQRHSSAVSPWFSRLIVLALCIMVLAGLWRVWRRLQALREIRREMKMLRQQLQPPSAE
jgi:uncharacterized membrane protein